MRFMILIGQRRKGRKNAGRSSIKRCSAPTRSTRKTYARPGCCSAETLSRRARRPHASAPSPGKGKVVDGPFAESKKIIEGYGD